MLQRNEAAAEKQTAAAQLLSLCSRAWEGQLLKPPAPWSPCSTTREATSMRSVCTSEKNLSSYEGPAQPEINR